MSMALRAHAVTPGGLKRSGDTGSEIKGVKMTSGERVNAIVER
jgi:hypothetical protein